MIATFLLEHRWLSPAALLLLVALGPFAGAWAARRPRTAWRLTALASLPVLVLTLAPTTDRAFQRCAVAWSLPTVGRAELLANVVLFVAPVLLAGVASRRPLLVLAGASAFSAGIEALQAFVPVIGRSCDTNDWSNNTIGASLGAGLAVVALRLAPLGRPRVGPPVTPSPTGVPTARG